MAPESSSSKITKDWLRFNDAPTHPRARKIVVDALPYKLTKPTNIENLRHQIQKHVDDLLAKVIDRHQMDVIADLALPLPVRTQATIIANAPVEDFERLAKPLLFGFLNGVRYPFQMDFWTEEAVERANQASRELEEYFTGLLAQRRQNPQEDFMSRLLGAHKQDNTFTDSHILQLCVENTVCGIHETSMALIADSVYLVLSSGQFEQLKENPDRAQNAVEETARFHSPNPLQPRIAKETLSVGGKTIEEGQLVFLNVAAANRDPEKFPNADHFDINRPGEDNGELAFGWVAHACPGRPLIGFVTQVVLETLASRMPNLKLQQWPENGHYTLRYQNRSDLYLLESLPVTF
jgi:cytochrome P450